MMLISIYAFAEGKTYKNEYDAIVDLLKGVKVPEYKETSFDACTYITEHVAFNPNLKKEGFPGITTPIQNGWAYIDGKLYHLSREQRKIIDSRTKQINPVDERQFLIKRMKFMRYRANWWRTYIMIDSFFGPRAGSGTINILKNDKDKGLILKAIKILWVS